MTPRVTAPRRYWVQTRVWRSDKLEVHGKFRKSQEAQEAATCWFEDGAYAEVVVRNMSDGREIAHWSAV